MNSIFCKNLKYLRRSHNLTQEKLSSVLGYSSKNLSKWENGLSIPNVETLKKITEIFDVNSIDKLLYDDKYYSKKTENDFKMIAKYEYDISYDEVEFYNYLVQNKLVNLNQPINIPIHLFNSDFIFKAMNRFKEFNIIESFEVLYKEDETKVTYKYSKTMYANNEKVRPTLLDMLNKHKFYKNEKVSQNQFDEFVNKEKIGKQALLILSSIFEQKVMFTLNDLYYHEEKNRWIQTQYKKNNDYKKIIRSNLSIISEYGLILKIGKGVYRRKLIINQDIDLVKDLIKTELNFDFNKSLITKKLDINFNETLTIEDVKFIIDTINSYLKHKVNLNIIEYFDIYIVNENLIKILKSDIRIFLNLDLKSDCVVYYK